MRRLLFVIALLFVATVGCAKSPPPVKNEGRTLRQISEDYYHRPAQPVESTTVADGKGPGELRTGMVISIPELDDIPQLDNGNTGQPAANQAADRIIIADAPGTLAPKGTNRTVLFELSPVTEADRQFLGEIWKKCAVFDYSDWVNVAPDAPFREIVISYNGTRLSLISWHPALEKSGKEVATSRGMGPLNGRTVSEAPKDDDTPYDKKRKAFDSIVAQCLSRSSK